MDTALFEQLRERLSPSKLSKPALFGVVVVIIMVAVAAGRFVIGTATASQFEIERSSISDEGHSAPVEEQAGQTIFVHVSGEVAKPGLYELEGNARVANAIEAAGGFTEEASSDSINLARIVTDGEHIVVANTAAEELAQAYESSSGPVSSSGTGGLASSGLVNINMASASELESLPGIGSATAQKIIADRQSAGPYKSIDDLKRVSGIGEKKLESLRDLICV